MICIVGLTGGVGKDHLANHVYNKFVLLETYTAFGPELRLSTTILPSVWQLMFVPMLFESLVMRLQAFFGGSVTRLGDLLDFEHVFKAFGNN